jgi:acetyl esterase/lipase
MLSNSILLAALVLGEQAPPAEKPLWDGPAPESVGTAEKNRPTLTAYFPSADKATGTAVVICPGGGYGFLALDHEGKQVADWLTERGVAAFVLKYRIVAGKDRPGPLGNAPLLDAQRAIRTVRANAEKYRLDPKKIGIWGFSAGGHLASTAATHFDAGDPKAADPIDRVSSRPDFAVLAYPVISMKDGVTHGGSRKNLIGDKPEPRLVDLYSNESQVTKETPPTFLFHTVEDKAVLIENSKLFEAACKSHNVPVELYIVEKGVHGVGLGTDPKWAKGEPSVAAWPGKLETWMKGRKLLEKR